MGRASRCQRSPVTCRSAILTVCVPAWHLEHQALSPAGARYSLSVGCLALGASSPVTHRSTIPTVCGLPGTVCTKRHLARVHRELHCTWHLPTPCPHMQVMHRSASNKSSAWEGGLWPRSRQEHGSGCKESARLHKSAAHGWIRGSGCRAASVQVQWAHAGLWVAGATTSHLAVASCAES